MGVGRQRRLSAAVRRRANDRHAPVSRANVRKLGRLRTDAIDSTLTGFACIAQHEHELDA